MASDPRVKAVDKALRALLAFKAKPELSATELSVLLGIHKSSVLHLCSTLADLGFVARDEGSKKYRLGITLFELGTLVQQRMELRGESLPFLRQLRDELRETVYLVTRQGAEGVCIERLDWEESGLQVRSPVGRRLPLIRGAAREVLLAHLQPEEQARVIATSDFTPLTSASTRDPQQLLDQLAQIRQQGYALDQEEAEPGVTGVGVAIRDHAGQVVASLSVAGPTVRMVPRLPWIIERVRLAAVSISRVLGWSEETNGAAIPAGG